MSAENRKNTREQLHRRILALVLCAMFGAIMYCSKVIMAAIPNVHLLGMFIMVLTIVYRYNALLSIYIFVALTGLFDGVGPWWVSYLYIWTVLWGVTMLLPREMPKAVACVVYPLVCALHGLLFGVMCAPVQALFFGFGKEATLAWIAAGAPFDIMHGISNLGFGILIYPLSAFLKKLMKTVR